MFRCENMYPCLDNKTSIYYAYIFNKTNSIIEAYISIEYIKIKRYQTQDLTTSIFLTTTTTTKTKLRPKNKFEAKMEERKPNYERLFIT